MNYSYAETPSFHSLQSPRTYPRTVHRRPNEVDDPDYPTADQTESDVTSRLQRYDESEMKIQRRSEKQCRSSQSQCRKFGNVGNLRRIENSILVHRRLQSVLRVNDDSPSATSGTIQANEESSGEPITLIIPEAIGTEELEGFLVSNS